MNKHILPLLALLCICSLLQGQREDKLPSIEIKEDRLSAPLSKNTRSVDILTKDEIKYAPVTNINELLQFVGGLDIRRRGPHGVQADMGLRGSTFEQVLILINGIKIIDPQTGHHLLNLPIDKDVIQRIEIIKGGAGRIYGQGAFAGAINIITALPEKSQAHFGGLFGQHGLFNVHAGGNLKTKKSNTYLSYKYESADPGYRKNNYFTRHNAFLQSDYKLNKGKISLLASFVDNAFGANSFYATPGDSTSYEEVQTSFVALQSEHKLGKTILKPSAYFRQNKDHYVYKKSEPTFYQNFHTTQVFGASVNAQTVLNKHHALGYGVDLRSESIESTNLGNHDRLALTSNLEYRLYMLNDKLRVTPGVSYNYYSDFGQQFLWGADAAYSVTKRLSVFFNYGTTYRNPTYTDLYYVDRSNVGNKDLKPEYAKNTELGLKYVTKLVYAQASYFQRNGTDVIDWNRTQIPSGDTTVTKWKPSNLLSLPVSGVDVNAVFHVGRFMFLSPLRTLRVSYNYLDVDTKKIDLDNSKYALEHIEHQYAVYSHWSFMKFLKITTAYRHVDRFAVDSYNIWDFGFGLNFKGAQFMLNVNNAFNTYYYEYPSIPMPKRWLSASLKYVIK